MPPQQPLPGGGGPPASPTSRPATVEDVIQAYAKKYGVSPKLALAVAKRESSFDPNAIGDSGKALGTFQLHEGAAADVGVDRTNPFGNIEGGIKYLKTLSDRYQGDVAKTLMAYNGGMKWVDEGKPSAAAQTYANEILAELTQQAGSVAAGGAGAAGAPGAPDAPVTPAPTGSPAPAPSTRPPVAGRGTATQNIATTAAENAYTFGQAYDPATPEGRQNLLGGIGSVASLAITRGMPVGALTTRIVNVLAPVMGAALGGAIAGSIDESMGRLPAGSTQKAALTQGAYDLGGQLFIWPVRRVFRSLIAPKIADAAVTGLKTEAHATKVAGRTAVEAIRDSVADTLHGVRQAMAQTMASLRGEGVEAVGRATQVAGSRLAQIELDNAATIAVAHRAYDDLLAQTPSTMGAAAAVRQTLEGPTRRALDLAGQRVAQAAETGPMVSFAPIKEALEEMANRARPAVLFQQGQQQTPGLAFLGNIRAASRASAGGASGAAASGAAASSVGGKGMGGITPGETARFNQLIAQQLGIDPTKMHPELPGLLGKILDAPDQIAFRDAHQIKMLLDEAVNWDRTAKKHLEKLTKGVRSVLRDQMTGHAEYDTATAAYQAVIPLYRKGVGKSLIRAANDNPDRIVKLLRDAEPANARALKQLLVDQAAAGGDVEIGQRAWDAVRSVYTYDHLIAGGVDKLDKRLSDLVTLRPEFVREVYGDPSGAQVLTNLGAIADAYKEAVELAAQQTALAKQVGKAGVSETKAVADFALEQQRQAATTAIREAQRQGSSRVRAGLQAARDANATQQARADRFRSSSLGKYSNRTFEAEAGDVVRAAALGLKSYWGGLSLVRLLRSPSAADLVEWAAYSSANTQRIVNALTKPGPPETLSLLFREVGSVLTGGPVPSHTPASSTPPATSPR